MKSSTLSALALSALSVSAFKTPVKGHSTRDEKLKHFGKRQDAPVVYPAPIEDYMTITSPSGVNVRYKEPGKEGVCETTPGVNSYSGYIDLAPNMHSFFWFFESRSDPASDPITLWLNGGPGSDSQIGLFEAELGPCAITEDLHSYINPYSWTNVSNMIFLSQPFGTGFSYMEEEIGSLNNVSGAFQNASEAPPDGRYPTTDPLAIDTTQLAAMAGWEIIQAFYANIDSLDPTTTSKVFNLWTESYGGHYGPAFFHYFQDQNDAIANGTSQGTHLEINTLGLINAIISERIQAPYYPIFANNNTYGIKALNDTVYNYATFAYYMDNGCRDQIDLCAEADQSTAAGQAICTEAADMCRDNVESPYYFYGERGVYDIRHPYDDPTPADYFADYLNQGYVQQAIGVDLNYTTANNDIYWAFQQTGDFVYTSLLEDLQDILNTGVSVSMIYGDADYIVSEPLPEALAILSTLTFPQQCNWFGGEAVSKEINYTNQDAFRAAGYVPMILDNGTEVGETRQAGNFSFTRVYESGHEVPYYQPEAAFALFSRAISHRNVADGKQMVAADYDTQGEATATHTEPFVALPSSTSSSETSATQTGTAVPKVARMINF
ncbi:MAG: hypothetical protein Q9162_006554 [Coniocarpon cinnabarinum]